MFLRAFTVSIGLLVAGPVLAADKPGPGDWPRWRGPANDAISKESGLLQSWPKDGPPKVWTGKNLGTGFGTPSVANGKVFGVGTRGGKDGVWAIKESDGSEVWFTPFADPAKTAPQANGPASTPTYYDGKVYAVSGNGTLACFDAATGKLVWDKSYQTDFGGKVPTWGYSDSVLVDGDKLICIPGGSKAAVAALKPTTGEVVWKTEAVQAGGGGGYSSPVKTTVGGIPMYVALLGQSGGLIGVHADTGRLLWRYTKAALGGVAQIPTPIVQGDKIWLSTAYKGGSALLQLVPEDSDKVMVKELKTYNTDLMNHHGGMVLLDGYVYFGHGQNNGIPACVNFKTGDLVWKADKVPPGGSGSAAYLFADGLLYIRYQNGLLALAKPSPKEEDFRIVSSFKLPPPNTQTNKESWPHPVIANGKLFIRDQNQLYCYNIKASMN
ncbi:MAG: bamB 3 [Gemmataceae bacterium]|nr:bamB 3 [Gemmataceae bacterium]